MGRKLSIDHYESATDLKDSAIRVNTIYQKIDRYVEYLDEVTQSTSDIDDKDADVVSDDVANELSVLMRLGPDFKIALGETVHYRARKRGF